MDTVGDLGLLRRARRARTATDLVERPSGPGSNVGSIQLPESGIIHRRSIPNSRIALRAEKRCRGDRYRVCQLGICELAHHIAADAGA